MNDPTFHMSKDIFREFINSRCQDRMTFAFKKLLSEFSTIQMENNRLVKVGGADFDECVLQAHRLIERSWNMVALEKIQNGSIPTHERLWIYYRMTVNCVPLQVLHRDRLGRERPRTRY